VIKERIVQHWPYFLMLFLVQNKPNSPDLTFADEPNCCVSQLPLFYCSVFGSSYDIRLKLLLVSVTEIDLQSNPYYHLSEPKCEVLKKSVSFFV